MPIARPTFLSCAAPARYATLVLPVSDAQAVHGDGAGQETAWLKRKVDQPWLSLPLSLSVPVLT